MIRTYIFFRTLCSILFILLFSTYSNAQDNLKEKVSIGVIVPLSGSLAEYGVAIRNGIEMAGEKHSSLRDEIRWIFEDSKYDPKTAVSSFHKLASVAKVDLVLAF